MKRSTWVVAAGVLFLVSVSGCNPAKKEASAPAPQAQPAANPAQADDSLAGKVVETMNAGGYTSIAFEKNGKKTWIAIPEAKVKVGQEVACQPGMVMKNFSSPTLKRTFDSIVFSGGLR